MESMKLYDIPRGSRIKAETSEDGKKLGDFIIFHRLDGMFSYCTVEGSGEVCHLHASTPLIERDGYYEIPVDKPLAHAEE